MPAWMSTSTMRRCCGFESVVVLLARTRVSAAGEDKLIRRTNELYPRTELDYLTKQISFLDSYAKRIKGGMNVMLHTRQGLPPTSPRLRDGAYEACSPLVLRPIQKATPLMPSFRSLDVLMYLFVRFTDFAQTYLRRHYHRPEHHPHSMCIRVVEKFPVCGCIYHTHSVDRCAYYGRHPVVDKVVWVGACCQHHKTG
jgi:hypothetical protein